MQTSHAVGQLEQEVLSQLWFYQYTLPSGRTTELYIPLEVEHIHRTRRDMMLAAIAPLLAAKGGELTAIDVASHQGWFSIELARHCRSVLGLEYQARHVGSARLMAKCLGVPNVEFRQANIETIAPNVIEPADIVINFGLMYNLENPIGALRRCREMTKRLLLIETQCTILDLDGAIDSGHHSASNYMHGYWGVFAGNPENIDGSASDIVFYPSRRGLCWVLEKLGFREVQILVPPPGAYQQLATGKRIMVAARL
ncbi:MAG: class I SAM-dependent methyltransferase [Bradyrhizobium sp.]